MALMIAAFALALALPQVWITLRFSSQMYGRVGDVPAREYAVVFGAAVSTDQSLSDVTRERIEGAIRLYQAGTVRRLFISGDNRHNQEADAIARYAEQHGVRSADVLVDRLGIDTHDTCRHFAQVAREGVLVTQEFHLPRAMYFCANDGVDPVGLAVNRLDLLPARGDNAAEIYAVRAGRYVREAVLTWSFLLGLYDRWSHEAEDTEQGRERQNGMLARSLALHAPMTAGC